MFPIRNDKGKAMTMYSQLCNEILTISKAHLLDKHPQLKSHSLLYGISNTHLQLLHLDDHQNPLFQNKAFA